MIAWIPPDPATVGDVDAVRALAETLPTLTQRASDTCAGVTDLTRETMRHWQGSDAEAWYPTAMLAAGRALTLQSAGCGLQEKLGDYLEELDRISGLYVPWAAAIESSVEQARGFGLAVTPLSRLGGLLRGAPADAGAGAPGVRVRCAPASTPLAAAANAVGSAADLTSIAAEYEDQINGQLQIIDQIYEYRDEADRSLAYTLRTQTPDSWAEQRELFTAQGFTTAEEMTPAAYAGLFGAEAAGWVAGSRLSAVDLRRLDEFYDQFGHDRAAMSAFVDALGGSGIVALTTMIGDAGFHGAISDRQAAELGQTTRSALSMASATWSATKAAAYAEAMMAGADDARRGPAVIGYLFNAPESAPIGATLTVAMASLIDLRDRGGFAATGNRAGWVQTVPGGGLYLGELEGPAAPGHPRQPVADAMGRVLETLGRYPDAARAWLTDPAVDPFRPEGSYAKEQVTLDVFDVGTLGGQRLLYYFGEREWSAHDGFEGPAALWAAVAPDPGGSEPFDSPRWATSAGLTAAIVTALANNPAYLPEFFSDKAAVTLAETIGRQLPLFGEVPVTAEPRDREVPVDLKGTLLGAAVPLPNLSDLALSLTIGPVSDTDAGAAVLAEAMERYRSQTLEAVATGAITAEQGLDRALQMEMSIAGSSMGSSLGQRDRLQDNADEALTLGVLGGTSGNTGMGSFSTFGLGAVVGKLQDAASTFIVGQYRDEAALISLDVSSSPAEVEAYLHEVAWAYTDDYVSDLARRGVVANPDEIGRETVDHALDQFVSELGRWR